MLVPLHGFLAGDTLGLLVLMQDHETVADLAARLVRAAAPRVAAPARPSVFHAGKPLDPGLTIAQAGLHALDRVDVMERAR
jgi:Toluene-4-monooxygenase system protein B (TmoB)